MPSGSGRVRDSETVSFLSDIFLLSFLTYFGEIRKTGFFLRNCNIFRSIDFKLKHIWTPWHRSFNQPKEAINFHELSFSNTHAHTSTQTHTHKCSLVSHLPPHNQTLLMFINPSFLSLSLSIWQTLINFLDPKGWKERSGWQKTTSIDVGKKPRNVVRLNLLRNDFPKRSLGVGVTCLGVIILAVKTWRNCFARKKMIAFQIKTKMILDKQQF